MTDWRFWSALRPLATFLFVLGLGLALAGVAAAAPGGKPGRTDSSLIGAWLFDEGTGDIAYDRTANGHDGLITGPTWTKGRIAGGLEFDGLVDLVTVPGSVALEPQHVTAASWFRASASPGGYRTLVFKGVTDCSSSSYSLKTDWTGEGIVFMIGTADANPVSPVAKNVWDGLWHHVAGTFDGSSISIYLDGQLVGSTTRTTSIRYTGYLNGDYLGIGHPVNLCGQTTQFTGVIDEVKIWSRAITAAEILALATPKNGRK